MSFLDNFPSTYLEGKKTDLFCASQKMAGVWKGWAHYSFLENGLIKVGFQSTNFVTDSEYCGRERALSLYVK